MGKGAWQRVPTSTNNEYVRRLRIINNYLLTLTCLIKSTNMNVSVGSKSEMQSKWETVIDAIGAEICGIDIIRGCGPGIERVETSEKT
jgi:hypothetical protein